MSAWGDTLTEQLAHDILMDQQQPLVMSLTGAGLRCSNAAIVLK
jgi:hypothetical protein